MMPRLDGMSATRNIRQYDTWTPIISMTSNTTDQDIQQYFLSGMTDVLPKPLNQGTLGSLLERYCAHLVVQRQHQQQLQLLQQNYSLNGSLIDINMTPQLTLIEEDENNNTNNNEYTSYSNSIIPHQQQQQQWYLHEKRSKINGDNNV
jgi:osomolarity two-component system response regulator SKN7